MAVRLVQVPEVVDVEERDPERLVGLAGRLDRDRQRPDQGTVIQRAGHLIQPSGLEEFVGLPEDAALRGAKHEVQGDGRQGAREQGDDHHLATELIQVPEDRCRISPDTHDRDDLAVELDREVRPQDVTCRQDRADGLGIGDRMEPGRDRSVGRGHEVRREESGRSGGVVGVGQQDRAAWRTDFDAQDLPVGDDRPHLGLEGGGARRGQAAWPEIGRDEVGIGEAPDGRCIRADDRVQHRLRRLGRHDDRLAQGGQADDHQEEAEDDDQEDRPPKRTERCTEQGADSVVVDSNVLTRSTSVLVPKGQNGSRTSPAAAARTIWVIAAQHAGAHRPAWARCCTFPPSLSEMGCQSGRPSRRHKAGRATP